MSTNIPTGPTTWGAARTVLEQRLDDVEAGIAALPDSGTSVTVNGIAADESGAITLDAATVGAAPASIIGPGKNLYNPADPDVVTGKYLDWTTGAVATSAPYFITGYIPVTPGQAYTISNPRSAVFYDATKTIIPGSVVDNPSYAAVTRTAPAGAAYLRASSYTSIYGATFQVEKGTAATAFESYAVVLQESLSAPIREALTEKIDAAPGFLHARGEAERVGSLDYTVATFHGYGLPVLVTQTTKFDRVTFPIATTGTGNHRVRVYSLPTFGSSKLVPAGSPTSTLLADVTVPAANLPAGTAPQDTTIALGQTVLVAAGLYVVVLITSASAGALTIRRWTTNPTGDRLGFYMATDSPNTIAGPGSLPNFGATPPRLDFGGPPVASIVERIDAVEEAVAPPDPATLPLPAHKYIDLWTSHIFDGGRNVYVTGQGTAATTAASAAAGATTLDVASAAGYTAGVSIVTGAGTATQQVARIASVAGNTFTLVKPLQHPVTSGQGIRPLWFNASHLTGASESAAGYLAMARHVAFHTGLDGYRTIPTDTGKVTILGNSWISQGAAAWTAQLQAAIPGVTVVNAGVGGNNTAALLARFDTDVPADSDVIILFEWVNDAYGNVSRTQQATNWKALVDKARAITPNGVVIVGPAPLNEYPDRAATQQADAVARSGHTIEGLTIARRLAELS
ncbi:SGNH/GDSL hydrolase family protein [Ornithinimicrobium cerasi]|uniref:SGNH/GDSL hydrolase family protein n=1 Tax=Ornithinimicrobium cerasi TaxID=2248773 RepID=UPI000EFE8412|nr:SGNH/GDSL hydrolase family protein [Ornithinimicrobium cerasi]